MNAEMVAQTIQLILAPVVMVSACAILQGGLLGHYATINDRLRNLTREHLNLAGAPCNEYRPDGTSSERLQEINFELPDLLYRHKLARDAILAVYIAIFVFVLDMCVIASSVISGLSWIAALALILFLVSTLGLLWGLLMTAIEIRISHRAIQYEVERMIRLHNMDGITGNKSLR